MLAYKPSVEKNKSIILCCIFSIIVLQKIALLGLVHLIPSLEKNFSFGDMQYYLDSKSSALPYYYWRSFWNFTDLSSIYPQIISFVLSTSSLFIFFVALWQHEKFNSSTILLIIILMVANPYYNLYYIKNTPDSLTMNILLLFYAVSISKISRLSLIFVPAIALGKPFLIFIIGYQIYVKKLLPMRFIFLGVLTFVFLSIILDYRSLFFRFYHTFDRSLLDIISAEAVLDYFARLISFFSQRERFQFSAYSDLLNHVKLNGIFALSLKLLFSSLIISAALHAARREALVVILTILLVCLNAGHLRYAFAVALAFILHRILNKCCLSVALDAR